MIPRLLIIALLAAALAGCTAAQRQAATEGASLAAEVKLADSMLQRAAIEDVVLSASVTSDQFEDLERAQGQYQDVRERLKRYTAEPLLAVNALNDLEVMHLELYEAAQTVKAVVIANWQDYSEAEKAKLSNWWTLAARLESQYQAFIVAAREAESEQTRNSAAMETILILARIAAAGV